MEVAPPQQHRGYQAEPPSPSLTNPDMILPMGNATRQSVPSPSRSVLASTTQLWGPAPGGTRLSVLAGQATPGRRFSGKPPRPLMSGPWQKREDMQESREMDSHLEYSPSALQTPRTRTPTGAPLQVPHPQPSNPSPKNSVRGYSPSNHSDRDDASRSRHGSPLLPREDDAALGEYGPADEVIQDDDSSPVTQSEGTGLVRAMLDEDESDPQSHTALSIRAEEILANAKKRLTAMEGNLSRARRLSINRSESLTSVRDDARPSPRPSRHSLGNSWAISSAKLRQANEAGASPPGGHSRVFSETSAGPMPTNRYERAPRRSASALGVASTRPYSKSPDLDSNGTGTNVRPLEPLKEDDLPSSATDPAPYRTGSPMAEDRRSSRFYSTVQPSTGPMTRARSHLQLRDLREQMQDLRSKIGSLKERTRQDSVERRSLQPLKSPSPFTHAEGWGDPAESARNVSPLIDAELGGETPELQGHIPTSPSIAPTATDDFVDAASNFAPSHSSPSGRSLVRQPSFNYTPATPTSRVKSSHAHPEETSPFSSPTYHDTPSSPIAASLGTSHEDNPDAFDYSQFINPAALGGPYSPSSSRSSTSSTRTTRAGPSPPAPASPSDTRSPWRTAAAAPPNGGKPPSAFHSRRLSTDSVSSINSFATAIERSSSRLTARNRTPVPASPEKRFLGRSSVPSSPSVGTLTPLRAAKARSAILGVLFAAAESAVGGGASSRLDVRDERLLSDIVDGMLGAAEGLLRGAEAAETWRMRGEVAKRALCREKPSDGF